MIRQGANPARQVRSGLAALLLFGVALHLAAFVTGCSTAGFYCQAARGQLEIWSGQESVDYLLKDPALPADLRERFLVVGGLRQFAREDLGLPVDGHYWKYIDLRREYVIWNVQAAPELSLQPKTWWYPFLGRQEYRGYFSEQAAVKYARSLKSRGWDVYVGGVDAYSTLGWFKDPLLNTFIFQPDPFLADLLFHELAHQRLFTTSDTDFNEAFATFVGQEGTRQWLRRNRPEAEVAKYEAYLERNGQFVDLALKTRERLEGLYGETGGTPKNTAPNIPPEPDKLRREKERILLDMERQFSELKATWTGMSAYDEWFSQPVNNAQLNSVANYYSLVPGFERLFAREGGDWSKFYREAEELSRLPKKDRHAHLEAMASAPRTRAVPDR
jgi:predicted aminopeptidase